MGVVLWKAVVIHLTLSDLSRKATSWSFVAFERSTAADLTGNKSKLPIQRQMSNGRTGGVTSDVERFEGMITPLHQRRCQRNIFFGVPRQCELPEVDTAR